MQRRDKARNKSANQVEEGHAGMEEDYDLQRRENARKTNRVDKEAQGEGSANEHLANGVNSDDDFEPKSGERGATKKKRPSDWTKREIDELKIHEAKFMGDEKMEGLYNALKLHMEKAMKKVASSLTGETKGQIENRFDLLSKKMEELNPGKVEQRRLQIEETCKLPWKSVPNMVFALKYYKKSLEEYVRICVPGPALNHWILRICRALLDEELARHLLFVSPRGKGSGEERTMMGRTCIRAPNQFSGFIYQLIADNPAIEEKNRRSHQKRIEYFLDNENRTMRKNEVNKVLHLALSMKGDASEVAALLICQDFSGYQLQVEVVAPDYENERMCKSWLEKVNSKKFWSEYKKICGLQQNKTYTHEKLIQQKSAEKISLLKKRADRFLERYQNGGMDDPNLLSTQIDEEGTPIGKEHSNEKQL